MSTWLHQLLVANLRGTVFGFWCNFQPCYVVLNIKKRRLKFYCDCWCPRRKKPFWKNSSPWTLTSEVNIWLGNHKPLLPVPSLWLWSFPMLQVFFKICHPPPPHFLYLGHFFPRKEDLYHDYVSIRRIRYQKGKLNVIKRQKTSLLGR